MPTILRLSGMLACQFRECCWRPLGPTSFPYRMTSLDRLNCSDWRRCLGSMSFRNSRIFLDLIHVQRCWNCSALHSHSLRRGHGHFHPMARFLCRFRCFPRCPPIRCSQGHYSLLHSPCCHRSRCCRRFHYCRCFRSSLNCPCRLSCRCHCPRRFLSRHHCCLPWQWQAQFPGLGHRPLRDGSGSSPGRQGRSTIRRPGEHAGLASSKRLTFAVGAERGCNRL